MILILWFALLCVFVGSYLLYFGYLRRRAAGPWGFKIDSQFRPSVSVIVPAFNEEKIIREKLQNLSEVSYPRERMEVVLIDDASTDQTLKKVEEFVAGNSGMNFKILHHEVRRGKAHALNTALNACSSSIVIVTDADTLLPVDIFSKTLPYLSNPEIGALSSVGEPGSSQRSWVANAEKNYLNMMLTWRLGESKIHSTFRFEGCFCAFKRQAFREFDSESGSDDSGTALRIIQNGFRTILVPEARVPAELPDEMENYVHAKIRRAVQLTDLWSQCLKLLVERRLKLPKKIAIPEIFLSLIEPFIFVILVGLTFLLLAYYPVPVTLFFVVLGLACLVPRFRSFLVRGIVDQFILFSAIILHFRKKKFVVWDHKR